MPKTERVCRAQMGPVTRYAARGQTAVVAGLAPPHRRFRETWPTARTHNLEKQSGICKNMHTVEIGICCFLFRKFHRWDKNLDLFN